MKTLCAPCIEKVFSKNFKIWDTHGSHSPYNLWNFPPKSSVQILPCMHPTYCPEITFYAYRRQDYCKTSFTVDTNCSIFDRLFKTAKVAIVSEDELGISSIRFVFYLFDEYFPHAPFKFSLCIVWSVQKLQSYWLCSSEWNSFLRLVR